MSTTNDAWNRFSPWTFSTCHDLTPINFSKNSFLRSCFSLTATTAAVVVVAAVKGRGAALGWEIAIARGATGGVFACARGGGVGKDANVTRVCFGNSRGCCCCCCCCGCFRVATDVAAPFTLFSACAPKTIPTPMSEDANAKTFEKRATFAAGCCCCCIVIIIAVSSSASEIPRFDRETTAGAVALEPAVNAAGAAASACTRAA